ncbi:hypothetical protein BU26DRAFT_504882 [Trematosphaeria pertusa]|uniref:Uncharacterized protein n=1 Tax=Trematosphaeria pertusa TaxID=390896 RepID=A0A6A6IDS8_9PLEO|nr:uncharacterized protein BU26DRAFT_504882 [Trematosphaeria pertusa]KAF2248725.1 hypothetical protein BU26DRAFT_504882 [Trematosphaeria pertusa]
MLPSNTILLLHLTFILILVILFFVVLFVVVLFLLVLFLLVLFLLVLSKPIVPPLRKALKLPLEDRLVQSFRASTRIPLREGTPSVVRHHSVQGESRIAYHFMQDTQTPASIIQRIDPRLLTDDSRQGWKKSRGYQLDNPEVSDDDNRPNATLEQESAETRGNQPPEETTLSELMLIDHGDGSQCGRIIENSLPKPHYEDAPLVRLPSQTKIDGSTTAMTPEPKDSGSDITKLLPLQPIGPDDPADAVRCRRRGDSRCNARTAEKATQPPPTTT